MSDDREDGAEAAANAVEGLRSTAEGAGASEVADAARVVQGASEAASAAQGLSRGDAGQALEGASGASRYLVPDDEVASVLESAGEAGDLLEQGVDALGGLTGATRNPVTFHLEVAGLDGRWGVTDVSLHEALNAIPHARIRARYDGRPERAELMLVEAKLSIERGEQLREFKGLVFRARIRDDGEGSEIDLQIAPAANHLAHTLKSRIHQKLTVVEVIVETYKDMLGDLQRSVDQANLVRTYEQREYIVQYQETNLAFISRLAEEEGIFWFFDHEADREVLVLADATGNLPRARPNDDGMAPFHHDARQAPDDEAVTSLSFEESFGATDIVVRDYDWTNPTLDVIGKQTGLGTSDPAGEIYDHTEAVVMHGFNGTQYKGNTAIQQAKMRAERLALDRQRWTMTASVVSALPGRSLEVEGAPDDLDGNYVIVAATSHGSATEGQSGTWQSSMDVIPRSLPYRPPHRTPRPIVHGPDTAIVVGPEGSEIHTDEHGRVKVRFHWDREHAPRENDSSCWMRVAHNWAGPGFGTFFLPRVDMEVVVSFLGGNPDRPIVTGCVYHGTNRAGVELEAKKTQSLIRTKSSPRSDGFNEMRFEDEAGNEFIYVHAEKDYNEEVEHDHSTHVKNNQSNTVDVDQTETVGNDQRMTVHNDRFHTVDHDEWVEVGHYRSEIVHGNEDWVIEGQRARTVKDDELLTVQDGHRKIHVQTGKDLETFDGGREVKVKEFDNLKVLDGANRNEHITGQYNVTVDGAHYTLVQGETEKFTQGSQKTYVESAKEVHAKTGSSHLLMKNDGKIKLAGDTKIELEVGACKIEMTTEKITLSAGSSSIELGPSGVTTSGSTVTSSAQTMNEITGLLVKIN